MFRCRICHRLFDAIPDDWTELLSGPRGGYRSFISAGNRSEFHDLRKVRVRATQGKQS
jgi:hypothetical protein